jgi:hypothetical protein
MAETKTYPEYIYIYIYIQAKIAQLVEYFFIKGESTLLNNSKKSKLTNSNQLSLVCSLTKVFTKGACPS